ncbi:MULTISPECIES: S24 family peptidase [unclassified Novosphingobium]|uniref:S24 family peptidase n=1 Tax=unclassified Novosphingobium TaxID=2644732 RepID=UPI001304F7E0|nr:MULTISPECIES: S24 family peptidase [unclassified Novosphingobium]
MILRDLMTRAGLTIRGFAQAAGYKHGSGVQRYVEPDFDGMLSPSVAKRMASALVGRGTPAIDEREIFSLVGIPEPNAKVILMEGASLERPQENLQVWGAALGCEREFDGVAVELTTLNTGDVIDYVRRPVMLNGKKGVYALHVQGSSMHPALPDGEMIVAAKDMPLSIGDNVVVFLRPVDHEFDDGQTARGVLVKELVRRSASFVELRQYQPAKDFRVDMRDVLRIDRVLTRREMLS